MCVKSKWKRHKARNIGESFKFFYYGVGSKRSVVGVVIKEDYYEMWWLNRVTCKSGGKCTQVDYIMCKRCNLKGFRDYKLVSGNVGRRVLGVSSGKTKDYKETWWWNEEVQDCIKKKRWDRAAKDIQQVRAIRDANVNVLTEEASVLRRWKEYFRELMNVENLREERMDEAPSLYGEVHTGSEAEVRNSMKRMKNGKAVGPDDSPVEQYGLMSGMSISDTMIALRMLIERNRED
ncbi:uncharacterized protein LOC122265538 [Penaeus japonicus]|uniref:uncharacterized protein LOC122265538 n=1 Tax=Penaeus japonicus TaxID=27405 RepID=UPI001C70DA68|nr:uncharacterized protein LOC122265538 [Penaeus japonicus]